MLPSFDILTALAAASILVVLALYLTVVYRKGWLKKSPSESFYLCPNPECRKIFQKPIVLTDLSKTPARVHPACPHCGFDLERASPFRGQKKPKMVVEVPPSPKKSSVIEDASYVEKQKRLEEPMVSVRTPEPANSVGLTEIPGKPTIAVETQELPEVPSEGIEAPRIPKEEHPPTISSKQMEAKPSGCPKFFGYLKRIPKNASLPDECFRCPKMVECLYYTFSE